VTIALWITVGMLVVLGWPALFMGFALVQEFLARRSAETER
jgi:hypothetical protein